MRPGIVAPLTSPEQLTGIQGLLDEPSIIGRADDFHSRRSGDRYPLLHELADRLSGHGCRI